MLQNPSKLRDHINSNHNLNKEKHSAWSFDDEFREKVVLYVKEHSIRKAMETFDLAERTINRWMKTFSVTENTNHPLDPMTNETGSNQDYSDGYMNTIPLPLINDGSLTENICSMEVNGFEHEERISQLQCPLDQSNVHGEEENNIGQSITSNSINEENQEEDI